MLCIGSNNRVHQILSLYLSVRPAVLQTFFHISTLKYVNLVSLTLNFVHEQPSTVRLVQVLFSNNR